MSLFRKSSADLKISLFAIILVSTIIGCDKYNDNWNFPATAFIDANIIKIENLGIGQVNLTVEYLNDTNLDIKAYGICFSQGTSDPTDKDQFLTADKTNGNTYSLLVSDLSPFTGYFFRPCICLENGQVILGEVQSIFTGNIQIATDKFIQTNFSKQSATLSGILNGIPANADPSFIDSFGFCLAQIPTPTLSIGQSYAFAGQEAKNGIFRREVASLETETTYYIRAFVVVNGFEIYGNICSFSIEGCWEQIRSLPSAGRGFAVGLEIGGKGYFGTGIIRNLNGNTTFDDWWEYDPVDNEWMSLPPVPNGERAFATAFSIGDYGYVGLGANIISEDERVFFEDFWQYDPTTKIWIQMDDFPGGYTQGAFGFSIDSLGYVGSGEHLDYIGDNWTGGFKRDFWQFDPSIPPGQGKQWKKLSDFEGTPRLYANTYSIGKKGYVISGLIAFNLDAIFSYSGTKDTWEYDPIQDKWSRKKDIPIEENRSFATGFTLKDKAYIGTGVPNQLKGLKDFWAYDPTQNAWEQVCDLEVEFGRGLATGISIDDVGYIGLGMEEPLLELKWANTFWKFEN